MVDETYECSDQASAAVGEGIDGIVQVGDSSTDVVDVSLYLGNSTLEERCSAGERDGSQSQGQDALHGGSSWSGRETDEC
jgi:hypothetical protein